MTEWKPIQGFEHRYRVSNEGQVYSVMAGGLMTIHLNAKGYPIVSLRKRGTNKTIAVHRLVAEAFIPNPDNLPHVNHIDGNKLNNHQTNLEWVTPAENNAHAAKLGLKRKGDKHPHARHSNAEVAEAIRLSKTGLYTQADIAEMFNTKPSTISSWVNGVNRHA